MPHSHMKAWVGSFHQLIWPSLIYKCRLVIKYKVFVHVFFGIGSYIGSSIEIALGCFDRFSNPVSSETWWQTITEDTRDIINKIIITCEQLSRFTVHLWQDHLSQLLISGSGNCRCSPKYNHSMGDNRCNLLRSLFKKWKRISSTQGP